MALATVPYRIQIDHDGSKYDVTIPNFSVPKCSDPVCGNISIDDDASEQIDRAFRKKANLLTPEEIREGRIRVGFPQQQRFADAMGIAVSTLSRWETEAQIQRHFHDGVLRLFFDNPSAREYLAKLHGVEYVAAGPDVGGASTGSPAVMKPAAVEAEMPPLPAHSSTPR